MLSLIENRINFDLEKCCQCGSCLAACKNNALVPFLTKERLNAIAWISDKCNFCQRCIAVCPAEDISKHRICERDLQSIKGAWIGKANNKNIAFNASSGGVTRTIIKYALERSLFSKAYCLSKSKDYPWAEGDYIEPPVQLNNISNSMYLPIMVNKNLKRKLPKNGLIVVGTNCQLLGVDRFFGKDSHNIAKIALLCKQQKTYAYTDHIIRHTRAQMHSDDKILYRGKGWPGVMQVADKLIAYMDAASLPFGRQLWVVPGCRYCGDMFGKYADLTMADPYGLEKEGSDGKTLVIARTEKGLNVINSLQDVLSFESINIDALKRAVDWKNYQKKLLRIDVYNNSHTSPAINEFLVKISDHQRRFLEYLLSHFSFPQVMLKIFRKLPLADDWIK